MGPGVRRDDVLRNSRASLPMLTEAATCDELYRNFRWDIPARFNIATNIRASCNSWRHCR